MSGVTVRPERSVAGTFTVPVAESGAVVLVREPERFESLDALNHSTVRIAVNAGGHLERVARARFPRATLVAIPGNVGVRQALVDAAVAASVTDTLEANLWQAGERKWARWGPFTRDRKAYLVRADRPDLAADLDAWLLARERDGTLARLRRHHLRDETAAATATVVGSLFAAIDERFSLMPMVGVAKREQGFPIEDWDREQVVIDSAVAGVSAWAEQLGRPAPGGAEVRQLFEVLIEAAKELQLQAVRAPRPDAFGRVPDLVAELRPALLRIGDRIARLLVRLPPGLDEARCREEARVALRAPFLAPVRKLELADALARISRSLEPKPKPRDSDQSNASGSVDRADRYLPRFRGRGARAA